MENLNCTNELAIVPKTKNQKGIEFHKKVATHLKAAARSHLKAAEQHELGNHHRATQRTLLAFNHVRLAKKAQNKILNIFQ